MHRKVLEQCLEMRESVLDRPPVAPRCALWGFEPRSDAVLHPAQELLEHREALRVGRYSTRAHLAPSSLGLSWLFLIRSLMSA